MTFCLAFHFKFLHLEKTCHINNLFLHVIEYFISFLMRMHCDHLFV